MVVLGMVALGMVVLGLAQVPVHAVLEKPCQKFVSENFYFYKKSILEYFSDKLRDLYTTYQRLFETFLCFRNRFPK
jgi:hypothetical protein